MPDISDNEREHIYYKLLSDETFSTFLFVTLFHVYLSFFGWFQQIFGTVIETMDHKLKNLSHIII